MNNQSVLSRFPKERKPLPQAYLEIYDEHYKKNRDGVTQVTSLSMRMEMWLHKQVAKDVTNSRKDFKTLEIGSGTLNHLKFEPNIKTYDVIEPYTALYENSIFSARVRQFYDDVSDIETDKKYDRIISIAVFEHILDLPKVVAESILHMEEDGVMRASIPNEGTLLWWLGTQLTGFEFRRTYHLNYQVLMRYEHVNTASEIEAVLRYFFKDIKIKVMGVCKTLAFYRYIECRKPNFEKAKTYLENLN